MVAELQAKSDSEKFSLDVANRLLEEVREEKSRLESVVHNLNKGSCPWVDLCLIILVFLIHEMPLLIAENFI